MDYKAIERDLEARLSEADFDSYLEQSKEHREIILTEFARNPDLFLSEVEWASELEAVQRRLLWHEVAVALLGVALIVEWVL